MASTDNFVGKVVGLVIAVVVICAVAIPILGQASKGMTGTEATIMNILPVFLVLAILIMIVKMFLNNSNEN